MVHDDEAAEPRERLSIGDGPFVDRLDLTARRRAISMPLRATAYPAGVFSRLPKGARGGLTPATRFRLETESGAGRRRPRSAGVRR